MELEFILWQKVISIDSYVPLDEWDATIEAIKLLKKLSIEAGGWLYWSEEKGSSICFVPFKDWKTLYENHKILSKE